MIGKLKLVSLIVLLVPLCNIYYNTFATGNVNKYNIKDPIVPNDVLKLRIKPTPDVPEQKLVDNKDIKLKQDELPNVPIDWRAITGEGDELAKGKFAVIARINKETGLEEAELLNNKFHTDPIVSLDDNKSKQKDDSKCEYSLGGLQDLITEIKHEKTECDLKESELKTNLNIKEENLTELRNTDATVPDFIDETNKNETMLNEFPDLLNDLKQNSYIESNNELENTVLSNVYFGPEIYEYYEVPQNVTKNNQVKVKIESLDLVKLKILFKSYTEIKANTNLSETEKDIQIINILKDIKYLILQTETANEFLKLNGLREIIYNNLNSKNNTIKSLALNMLAIVVNNNTSGQVEAYKSGSVSKMIKILSDENPPKVYQNTVISLSRLLRHYPLAQQEFLDQNGLPILCRICEKSRKRHLRRYILTFFSDLFSEQKQNNIIDFKSKLIDLNGCKKCMSIVTNEILRPQNDHDTVEKSLIILLQVADVCPKEFNNQKLTTILKDLNIYYKKLAAVETEEPIVSSKYFNNQQQLIHNLLTYIDRIKTKEYTR